MHLMGRGVLIEVQANYFLVEVVVDGKSVRAAFHKDDTVLLDGDTLLVKTEKKVEKVVQTGSGPKKEKALESVVPADVVWLADNKKSREVLIPPRVTDTIIRLARATTVTLPR